MKYTANPVEVQAYKITGVGPKDDAGNFDIYLDGQFEDTSAATKIITPEMSARFHPSVGDYFVVQPDGYEYLNPKDVFERKYAAVSNDPPVNVLPPNPIHTMYTPDARQLATLENNFVYHAPKGDQALRYGLLRDTARSFYSMLQTYCPPSRELSVALTELETACFWANASIARNEK